MNQSALREFLLAHLVLEFAHSPLKKLRPFLPLLGTEHLHPGEKGEQSFVNRRSQQHDSQEPKGGTESRVPQHVRGCTERGPHTAAHVSLENAVLSESSQTGEATDRMLPFLRNGQDRQVHRDGRPPEWSTFKW